MANVDELVWAVKTSVRDAGGTDLIKLDDDEAKAAIKAVLEGIRVPMNTQFAIGKTPQQSIDAILKQLED